MFEYEEIRNRSDKI